MIDALDFHELCPSPLTEAAARAFERGLSDRLTDALMPEVGPRRREQAVALKTQIRRLWETGDVVGFIAMALALHRIRTLNAGHMRRLASALLTQDRFEEAAALFPSVEEDDHRRWWDQARALAGTGRLTEAAEAGARCAERLAAAPPEPDVHAAVKMMERRPSRLDLAAGWPTTRAEVRVQLGAGQSHAAEAAFRGFLQRRASLLIEALQAAAEPEARDWPQLRRRAGAGLLLGLGPEAAERLIAGARSGIALPLGATDAAASIFAAASAGAPATRQRPLSQAFASLAEEGEARAFAELALKTQAGDSAPSELAAAPRPSAAVLAAVATMLAQAGRPELAVTFFGELSTGKRREAQREELAVCQSRETIGRLAFRTAAHAGPRRIFDLFPYNGELEVLRIKLHEMGPWVDRFVLVESAATFSGQPKPLRFDEAARAELEPFLTKISHVVIDRFADHVTSAWAREFHQRDQAIVALRNLCGPDDLVILSDVDEVVDRRALEAFEREAAPLALSVFRFFLNYRLAGQQECKAVVCRARHLERWGSSLLRTVLVPGLLNWRVPDAGWHFSSAGDAEDIARKLASYAHEENNRPDNEARYRRVIERLREGELEPGCERCALDTLPPYVAEDRERLAQMLL